MVRVSQCCCGYSLQTGTLIILCLTVIWNIVIAIEFMAEKNSIQILSSLLQLVLSALALLGISKKKPGYMMPFIGFSVFWIILNCIILLLLLFASTYITNSALFDRMEVDAKRWNEYLSYENMVKSVIFISAFEYALYLALQVYFVIVVYSYYHALKEQVKEAGCIIYGMPTKQGNTHVTGRAPYVYPTTYGQQPTCYSPQQPTSHPPAFGQQLADHPPPYDQQPIMYPQDPDQKVYTYQYSPH